MTKHYKFLVNNTLHHIDTDGNPVSGGLAEDIAHLADFPRRQQLCGKSNAAIERVSQSRVVLSFDFFHPTNKWPPNKNVILALIGKRPSARRLHSDLQAAGAFDFIKRQSDPGYAQNIMSRLIAAMAYCSAFNYPDAAGAHAVVDWYREPNGMRFREDIWGKGETGYQCLRELIRALSNLLSDKTLYEKSVNRRVSHGDSPTFAKIRGDSGGLQHQLLEFFTLYTRGIDARQSKKPQMLLDLISWLTAVGAPDDLITILTSKPPKTHFGSFLKERLGMVSKHVVSQVGLAVGFSEFILQQLRLKFPGVSFSPLVGSELLSWAKKQAASRTSKLHESAARTLPTPLFNIAKEILLEGEDGWLRKSGAFDVRISSGGESRTIYCPVIPTLLLTMFVLPLRTAQVKRLDSGEGDVERFNGETCQWERNNGPHAGHWDRKRRKKGSQTRGYAARFDGAREITGFLVNTNKTGDPYKIPWQNRELHAALYKLRLWQEEYNPLSGPIGPKKYVDGWRELSADALDALPDIFPLFRMPPVPRSVRLSQPPSPTQIYGGWHKLLEEVQRRWNEQNPNDLIEIIRSREDTGQLTDAVYNLHGLRAKGIMNLYERGIPIEIISKVIAGHATVVMTIYYMLFDPSKIDSLLSQAAVEERAQDQQIFIRDFKNWSGPAARERAVSLVPDALSAASSVWDKIPYSNVGIGFCPFGGERCFDGGPPLEHSAKGKATPTTYQAVPGGRRNCIMCRHLVSGPPWLFQLRLLGTSLLEKSSEAAERHAQIQKAIDQVHRQKRDREISGPLLKSRLDVLQLQEEQIIDEILVLETAVYNTSRLVQACLDLERGNATQNDVEVALPVLIANSEDSYAEFVAVTPFERVAALTAAGRVYPLVADKRVESSRDEYLNLVLNNAGIVPPAFRHELSKDQKRFFADQLSLFLLGSVDRPKLEALTSGKLRLQDIKLDKKVAQLCAVEFGQPLERNPI
ncbi:hypothetical protein GOD34_29950 [Sinorhizobium medicae]|nr:hypothetical protein [Sinorhizobium medicae]